MKKTNNLYAAYNGDDFLVVGTAQEVADYLGWDKNNVYVRICHKVLNSTAKIQIVPIEEGEEDEKN